MRYYVIDTETTGVSPEDKAVEVAIAEVDEDLNVLSECSSLIDPEMPISPSASGVHKITKELVSSSPTISEYFSDIDPQCYGGLLAGPCIFIGHNVPFDTLRLKHFSVGFSGEIDTLQWCRRLYPESENHKLSTMPYFLNLPVEDVSHRALADVKTTISLLKHIKGTLGLSFLEMVAEGLTPREVSVMYFGKYKGELLCNLRRDYLVWLSNLTDLDMDLKFTVSNLLSPKKVKKG